MAEERIYNIPIRKEFLKAPKYKRAKKAISAVKQFLIKHMKSKNIKLGNKLNQEIWKNGIRNPPHHIKVTAKKDDDIVTAELLGTETIESKVEDKKTTKPTKKEEKVKTASVEKINEKVEEKTFDKKEEPKKEVDTKTGVKETPKTDSDKKSE